MKQFITVLLVCITLQACQTKKEPVQTIAASVLVDLTDPHMVYPDGKTIIPLLGLNNNPNNKIVFKLLPITDRTLNPDTEIILDNAATTEKYNRNDNPLYRRKLVVRFQDSVSHLLQSFNQNQNSADSSIERSEVFNTITGELKKITVLKPDRGSLIIYSDLMENSDILSVYKTDNLADKREQGRIERRLEETGLLPGRLSKITVVVIYNPKSRQEDTRFMAMASVYRRMLEKRGAAFILSANNKPLSL